MRIPLNKFNSITSVILIGGLILIAPLFALPIIDMTDGICSHRFLKSAEEAAISYYEELGVPEGLPELIDSSYIDRDLISAVLYLYIAHLDMGMEETYLADIARVLSTTECYHVPESLYRVHLTKNPRDYRAIGDYALLLSRRKAFDGAKEILKNALSSADYESRAGIYEDLGFVLAMEYLETGESKTLERSFEAFRISRTGNSLFAGENTGKFWFNIEKTHTEGTWQYNYTTRIGHIFGSDAIILSLRSIFVFGREIETMVTMDNLEDIRNLFGSIYIACGETLASKPGAFEITSEMGNFAPFYRGSAVFEINLLFHNGTIGRFSADSSISLDTDKSLSPYYDALAYGEYQYAESVLTAISNREDGKDKLPLRWESSVRLSEIMDDSTMWETGLRFIDSLMNEESDPNLRVYRGALLYLLGRPEEAREELENVLLVNPNNFWAIYDLALVEYDLGNKEKAAQLFTRTRKINGRMYLADLMAGVIYEELGQIDKALERYNIAIRNLAFRNREIDRWIEELEEKKNIETDGD